MFASRYAASEGRVRSAADVASSEQATDADRYPGQATTRLGDGAHGYATQCRLESVDALIS